MARLLLVRHLKPLIESGICYGCSDVPAEQSSVSHDRLINTLSAYKLNPNTQLYSSPLTRCVQLSQVIMQRLSLNETIISAELAEIDFGDWEMQKWDDINRQQIDLWANDLMGFQFPNGESAELMQARIQDWLEALEHTEQDVVVVCHAGTIRQILSLVNGIEMSELLTKSVAFGEVVIVHKA